MIKILAYSVIKPHVKAHSFSSGRNVQLQSLMKSKVCSAIFSLSSESTFKVAAHSFSRTDLSLYHEQVCSPAKSILRKKVGEQAKKNRKEVQ